MPAFDPLKWFRTASTTSNWIPNLATNTESPGREGYVRGSSADCPANPNCGERGGTRTRDQLIKSNLLYRLRYPSSEERLVGKECCGTGRSRGSPDKYKK